MGTSGTTGLKKITRGYTQSDEFTPHLHEIYSKDNVFFLFWVKYFLMMGIVLKIP